MAKATPFRTRWPGAMLAQIGDFVMVSDKRRKFQPLLVVLLVSSTSKILHSSLRIYPLVVGVLIAVHFWRIRKDGGISAPLRFNRRY